ncbi:MAG: hypothetical protein AB7U75_00030 [Hyphomicrobiaceae bacterium]
MRLIGRQITRLAVALVLAVAIAAAPAAAQESATDAKQIKLTETQVKGFISAQKDLADISAKLEQAGDKPDEALQNELEAVAKKHGFATFEELDDVAASVSTVMAGLDPETGEFTDPKEAMKKELADIEADSAIPASEKKLLVEELNEAIKATPPIIHKENIEIVKKYRAEIEAAMQ